jgi:hypothetical protein
VAILIHRFYCLAIATFLLAIAHFFFQRKSAKALLTDGRLGGSAWAMLVAIISLAMTAATGWIVISLVR